MNNNFSKKTCLLLLFIFISSSLLATNYNIFAAETQLRISIIPVCGDGNREGSEQCDGLDLGGQTCASRGYTGGILGCNAGTCTFDVSNCTAGIPSGGGTGSSWIETFKNKLIIEGKAYLDSEVTLLSDGKIIDVKKTNSLANFEFEITDITSGVYTFSLWGIDKKGRRSITFSFTAEVVPRATTTVSGVFLPPTIELSESQLQRGEILNIFGQTAPGSEVIISFESSKVIERTTLANDEGDWIYSFDTNVLDDGVHNVKAKANSPEGLPSSFSEVLSFFIGLGQEIYCNSDLNNDNKVNLVDFSILLYWWGKSKDCVDLNGNGIVDLPDFSIMMYYWTG